MGLYWADDGLLLLVLVRERVKAMDWRFRTVLFQIARGFTHGWPMGLFGRQPFHRCVDCYASRIQSEAARSAQVHFVSAYAHGCTCKCRRLELTTPSR